MKSLIIFHLKSNIFIIFNIFKKIGQINSNNQKKGIIIGFNNNYSHYLFIRISFHFYPYT
jgi:hypothetical protein